MAGRPASRAQSGAPPAGGWGRVYGGDVVRGVGEEPPGHGGGVSVAERGEVLGLL